jgi:hypothetical protein
MKNSSWLLALAFAALSSLPLAGQNWRLNGIKGEGPKVAQDLAVPAFQGVNLAAGGKVYLSLGKSQSVRVEAQQNIIDNILTEVKDGVWNIRFDKPVRGHEGLSIWIAMPTLDKARVSGSGSIIGESTFTGLKTLDLTISGSGNISLDLGAAELNSSISGSGDMILKGSAGKHNLRISGSGNIKAAELKSRETQVRISGSGNCHVDASEELIVSTSGSGDVFYNGRPRVQAKVNGSGKVIPR